VAVASPRNHRQLAPRSLGFGKFLFATGVVAEGQDLSQVSVEGGSDALTVALWVQLDSVDLGAEHVGGLGPDGGVVQRLCCQDLSNAASSRP